MTTTTCHACSARVGRSHRFCASCGARRVVCADMGSSTSTTPPATDPHPASLSRTLQPERKQVTVLFVDLCESAAHVVDADPEEAGTCLDEALSLMTRAVEAYDGTVSQLLGDGLLALFGAPVAQEDHALRACLAALAMHRDSRAPRSGVRARPFVLRVGIHSGEVIVGLAGQYLWSHYRAVGTTLHVASRLERLAAPGSVCISEATQRLIADQLDTRPLGPQAMRGLGIDMNVFELLPAPEDSAAAPLARKHQWAPLVGRDQPLRVLAGLATAARGGAMRVVGLRGEPGIGKSRLIAEWLESPSLAGFAVCTAQARGYSRANAYGVIAELARGLEALLLAPRAGPAADESTQHLRALSDLIGVADADEAWLTQSPTVRRRRIVDALAWAIAQAMRTQPLLLVFEDIFLADRESQRLLEALVPRLDGLPALICVTYRQDFEHRWADASWFVEHWIAPLREPEMNALARSIVGPERSMQPVVDDLVERADGNPFFLEQLIITLIDNGSLIGKPGAYGLTSPQATWRVPGSITAVISARVDRLPPTAKGALEAAAVLGDPITLELIADMQDLEPLQARTLLRLGVTSGLLTAPSPSPDEGSETAFSFRHALVQDVVVGALTRPRRKALHRRAFQALKRRCGDADAEQAPMLTRHAFSGEDWESAAAYAAKSIARAVSRSANREALRLFELGVDAARRVPDRTQALGLELGLLLQVIGALMALGHIDAIFENLERANSIAAELGDLRCRATVSLQTSVFQWMRGRFSQGLDNAGQALAAGREAGRRSLEMAASQTRMMMLHGLGRYRDSVAAAQAVLADFEPELRQHRVMTGWATLPIINLHAFYANALTRLGQHEAAQAKCNLAYAMLARADHPYSRGLLDFAQSQLWIDIGRSADAVDLMQSSVEMCATRDVPTLMPCNAAMLGAALVFSGRASEAKTLLQRAIDDRIYMAGGVYGELFLRLYLGAALRQLGHLASAVQFGEQALELAGSGEQHGHRADALLELGKTLLAIGERERAVDCLTQALVQARRCEMPVYSARAEAQLARLAVPADA